MRKILYLYLLDEYFCSSLVDVERPEYQGEATIKIFVGDELKIAILIP